MRRIGRGKTFALSTLLLHALLLTQRVPVAWDSIYVGLFPVPFPSYLPPGNTGIGVNTILSLSLSQEGGLAANPALSQVLRRCANNFGLLTLDKRAESRSLGTVGVIFGEGCAYESYERDILNHRPIRAKKYTFPARSHISLLAATAYSPGLGYLPSNPLVN
jgi:hypothetical protein